MDVGSGPGISAAFRYSMGHGSKLLDSTVSNLSVFRGIAIDEPMFRFHLTTGSQAKKTFFIPDFLFYRRFPVVSEKFWNLLKDKDDFDHQAWEVSNSDTKGNIVPDQPMYFLNVRRSIEIEPDVSVLRGNGIYRMTR